MLLSYHTNLSYKSCFGKVILVKFDTEDLVNKIIKSYETHTDISRIDEENMINKKIIIEIIDRLRKILFPGYFDNSKIRSEYIRYIVGEHLEFIQYNLKKQIARALGSGDMCSDCPKSTLENKAEEITDRFLEKIPMIREYLYTDVQAAFDGDPAASSADEVIFSYPGLYAITVYRIAHELQLLNVPMIPRIMTEHAHSQTGIDIHPGAIIGKHFCIDHGTGIVVGETTTIGDNVKIYQGVTLGALSTRKGQELRGVKRHPTIGNNVTIYSETSILGGETVIGDGATIGGNAFIVSSIEAGTKVSVKKPELQYFGSGQDDF